MTKLRVITETKLRNKLNAFWVHGKFTKIWDILDKFGQVTGETEDFSYKILEKSIEDSNNSSTSCYTYHKFNARVFFKGYEFILDVLQIEDNKKFRTPEFRIY